MKFKEILIIVTLCLLLGCSTHKNMGNYIELKPIEEKYFSIEPNQNSFYYLTSVRKENDSLILIAVDNQKSTIYKYNFDSGRLMSTYTPTECDSFKSIFGKKKRKYHISEIDYVNSDSIFLRFHFLYFNGKEKADSTFMLTDWKGNVKNIYSYKNIPIVATENGKMDEDTCLYFAYPSDCRNYLSKSKIYLRPLQRWGAVTIGDSIFVKKSVTIGGHLDLSYPKGKYIPHKVYYPDAMIGHFYPQSFAEPLPIFVRNNTILYAWGYTPKVITYDFAKHNATKKGNIGSYIFDTIPYSHTKSNDHNDWKWAKYGRVFYDSLHHNFFRIIKQAPREGAKSQEFNYPQYTFTVCDTNFNVLGEGLLPSEIGKNGYIIPIFSDKGIYFWNREKTEKYKDTAIFTLYQMTFLKDADNKKLIAAIKTEREKLTKGNIDEGIINYLYKEIKITGKREGLILIPIENSCSACISKIAKYIKDNKAYLEKKEIKIILIGNNNALIESFMQLSEQKKENNIILIDDKNKILNYLSIWVNPRWIVIDGQKIVEDKILNPGEIPLIENFVKNFKK